MVVAENTKSKRTDQMKDIKSYLLEQLLPNRSDQERELYYRTNEELQKIVEVMKGYCEEMLSELENGYSPDVEELTENIDVEKILKPYREGYDDEDEVMTELVRKMQENVDDMWSRDEDIEKSKVNSKQQQNGNKYRSRELRNTISKAISVIGTSTRTD